MAKRKMNEGELGRPAFFWWTLANVLAACFAVLSWIGCLHVFGSPEIPRNYELLRRLGRLPVLKRMASGDAPDGVVRDVKGFYSLFYGLAAEQIAPLNGQFLRNYLKNYERPEAVMYLEGMYEVEEVRVLGAGDFVSKGLAVRCRALVKPDAFAPVTAYPVVVELVLPTEDTGLAQRLNRGTVLNWSRNGHRVSVLHAARVVKGEDVWVCATAMPMLTGMFSLAEQVSVRLEPPLEVFPEAKFFMKEF